ncbi:2-methylaconitate cis-trans isomerase PrpF [Bradyrhizobium sp. SK17]|uniref:2-methylaconitate cis-trans isomerase PrpF n=1 Tax=Bradyrhizobium sp. SK17 TaxID=2057741 RepID=UPI000C30861D|nr:2-methylaconitate cis-trans isomerase PrpF [Bradyrhizobium sp. SK17]AUC99114.1 2-methylaconitate cis-trans isomerase PrpF [Bradyrhizobium sp. SK17]
MNDTTQTTIRATYMRGGTSKGIFFAVSDLPAAVRDDPARRDHVLMRVIGSPDPYGTQIDGMGGATSSTSKVVLISPSSRPDCDVDYLFGAVPIKDSVIDWSGNCGNLTSAVGPFAITRGMVTAPADGRAPVRIWQANIGKRIVAHVPMAGGVVVELGAFRLDGVGFPAAEVELEFLDPGAEAEGSIGGTFPTGRCIETIDVPGFGLVEATLINLGNPTIFVDAAALKLDGAEMPSEVNGNPALLEVLEYLRAEGAVRMGLTESRAAATAQRPHTPKIAFVAPPRSYVSSDGRAVDAAAIDLTVRIMSMGKLHHAITGTGAVAVAGAAAIPGTIVSRLFAAAQPRVRIGHPAGTLPTGAVVEERNGTWHVAKVMMSRSARRLMDGVVYVPSTMLHDAG